MQQAYCERIFSDLPVLETSRLRLRPLKMGDAQDMFRYVVWETHESLRDSRRVLRGALRQYRRGEPSSYAVERRSDHRMIGTIGFMWVNLEHRSGEVGYSFARDCWGQGYATEALRAVLQFGFDTLRLHRIEAQHEVDNPASGRVMEKCGMQCEGVLRGRVFNKGHFSDVKLYAILRENNMMDNDK